MRARRHTLNGGFADATAARPHRMGYDVAEARQSENNSTNAFNASSSSTTNENKNNSRGVRPVAALGDYDAFLDSLVSAFDDCVKSKLSKRQAMEYLPTVAEYLPRLASEIWSGNYAPSRSNCFMVHHPKLREVFAADFRDRIVHHWICQRLSPVYEELCGRLGNPTHACRKGFGNRTALAQVEDAMLRISGNYHRTAWVYKGDIVSFFMSIDKRVMERIILGATVQNRDRWEPWEFELLKRLASITIQHSPHRNCNVKSDAELWTQIEPSKSMFYTPDTKSMPIGNLTTQLFAGFYMLGFIEEAHRLFAEEFGESWRDFASITLSVDDYVIVCADKTKLKRIASKLEKWLADYRLLRCHTDKVYLQPVSHGVKFLGRWLKPGRRYTINRTVGRFSQAVRKSAQEASEGMSLLQAMHWRSSLNSYLGLLAHTRSYRLMVKAMGAVTPEWGEKFRLKKIRHKYKIVLKNGNE